MSGVFRNIDPPPPHGPASVYPPPLVRGEDTLAGWRGGWGAIVRKTPDTALYSIYASTLWGRVLDPNEKWKKDNGFVAGKVGKYLLFVNCPQGEMGLEGGVNKDGNCTHF